MKTRAPSGSLRQNRPGETLTVDLGRIDTVRAVQVDFADYQSGRFADAPDNYTEFALQASADGQQWHEIARTEPPRRDRPDAYFELAATCARALHPLCPRACRRREPCDQRDPRFRQRRWLRAFDAIHGFGCSPFRSTRRDGTVGKNARRDWIQSSLWHHDLTA